MPFPALNGHSLLFILKFFGRQAEPTQSLYTDAAAWLRGAPDFCVPGKLADSPCAGTTIDNHLINTT